MKSTIRKIIRDYREGLSPERWSEIERGIHQQFRKNKETIAESGLASKSYSKSTDGKTATSSLRVLAYLPSTRNREIDIQPLISAIIGSGGEVAVPVVTGIGGEMDFVRFDMECSLKLNKWGIPEPESGELVSSGWADVCLLPMLASDRDGYRLGYGKGFYDRYLEGKELVRVGVCPADCVLPVIPHEPHDIPLDYLLTEMYFRRIMALQENTG